MSEQKRIKLVEGQTYTCTAFPGEDKAMKLGDEKNVDAKLADHLLGEAFTDKAGKERFYFDDVTPEGGVVEADEEDAGGEDDKAAPAAKTAPRAARKTVAPRKRN